MKTEKNKIIVFRTLNRFITSIILVTLLVMGCSKSDPGPDPFVEVDPGPSNTNNTNTNEVGEANVSIKSIDPEAPATLKFGDSVAITFDYEITRAAGARIWIQPYTGNDLSPTGTYTPSPVFRGTGTETVHISIAEGDTVMVDQLKIQVNTAGLILLGVLVGSDTLSESFELVDYTFTN